MINVFWVCYGFHTLILKKFSTITAVLYARNPHQRRLQQDKSIQISTRYVQKINATASLRYQSVGRRAVLILCHPSMYNALEEVTSVLARFVIFGELF